MRRKSIIIGIVSLVLSVSLVGNSYSMFRAIGKQQSYRFTRNVTMSNKPYKMTRCFSDQKNIHKAFSQQMTQHTDTISPKLDRENARLGEIAREIHLEIKEYYQDLEDNRNPSECAYLESIHTSYLSFLSHSKLIEKELSQEALEASNELEELFNTFYKDIRFRL